MSAKPPKKLFIYYIKTAGALFSKHAFLFLVCISCITQMLPGDYDSMKVS